MTSVNVEGAPLHKILEVVNSDCYQKLPVKRSVIQFCGVPFFGKI